jgi:predicted nucleotidyltransferase
MTGREAAMENIRHVARRLGPLRERAVFLGGAVTALLITDPAAPDIRPTKDIDVAVTTASLADTSRLEEELRSLGFQHCKDPGAPACRWVVGDSLVDVMPVGSGPNAYNDRWSPAAIQHAERLELAEGLIIRHVAAPYFVAIKLETFTDRGAGNYLDSQDIEDIVQVVDGRPELLAEVRDSEPGLRTHLAAAFMALLNNAYFLESLPAHLLPDAASQAREPVICQRMEAIAALESRS